AGEEGGAEGAEVGGREFAVAVEVGPVIAGEERGTEGGEVRRGQLAIAVEVGGAGLALVGDAVSVVVGARAVEDVALVAPAVLVAVGADGLGGDDAVDLAGGAGGAVADVDLA